MRFNFIVRLIAITALAAVPVAGFTQHNHDHGHAHEAPHGGTLIVFGQEFAHLELVLDEKSGDLDGYVLDGSGEKAIRIEQAEINLQVYGGDLSSTHSTQVKLKASDNPLTGEKKGDTSQFAAKAPALKGKKKFNVQVDEITIKGTKFNGTIAKFPEGNH